jgi:hypothetical protein
MIKRYILFLPLLFSILITSANNSYDLFVEKEVKIYPIPAVDYFTVEVPETYKYGKILIRDIVGKEVLLLLIEEDTKVKIPTDELMKGIYFVSIQVDNDIVFTQRIAIDK